MRARRREPERAWHLFRRDARPSSGCYSFRTQRSAGLAETDLARARTWAFELPQGPLRDAALQEYVRGEAHGGSVDLRIFDQFSTEAARGQAASHAAFGLSCDGHLAIAREIASTQIVSAALREQTERQIEQNAGSGASVGNSPANLFCVIGR